MPDLDKLQANLCLAFNDVSLLQQAMVHRSYLNENPDFPLPSNERLEFLGDALLGFVVAKELYFKFPHLQEGDLTELRAAMVRKDTLARLAKSLGLGDHLYLGRGEEERGGRRTERILASTFEAVVGATLLDQGFAAAEGFVLKQLDEELQGLVEQGLAKDYKSQLQELAQARWKVSPVYRTVNEIGPDHAKEFTVEVLVGEKVLGRGSGKSKQIAEKEAARAALSSLKVIEEGL